MIELFIVLQQIEDVLQSVIEFYHDNLGVSWGWSIVLLTVTVRIAILPLTIKQFRSMAAMQRIQPKVKALQNKYKGKSDPEAKKQQQAELMALYKEHNVNPFASCLPMVFQMPVFIGLYQTLRNFHPHADVAFLGINDIFVPLNQIGGATEVIMVLAYSLSMLGSTLLVLVRPGPPAEVPVRQHVGDLHSLHPARAGGRRHLLDHHQPVDDRAAGHRQAHDGPPLPGGAEGREAEACAAAPHLAEPTKG